MDRVGTILCAGYLPRQRADAMSNTVRKTPKLWATTLTVLAFVLPSCSGRSDANLVGRWVSTGSMVEIKENGDVEASFLGRRWSGKCTFVEPARRRGLARANRSRRRAFELRALTRNTMKLTEVPRNTRATQTQGNRRRLPQVMIFARELTQTSATDS